MARLFGRRPSELLGLRDPYAAYCVDEAAAWLLSQQTAPAYVPATRSVFNSAQVFHTLEKHRGAVIKGKEAEGSACVDCPGR